MDRRHERLDRIDAERRGPDFLSQVREVCRLRTDQDRSTSGAEITERNRGPGGAEFDHLVVRYTRGPFTEEHLVGVCEGPVSAEAVTRFRDAVCAQVSTERKPELVYRGELTTDDARRAATEYHIWLRSFAEYQQVWAHESYLATQAQRISGDPDYPLGRHVDKRWSELGEVEAHDTTAAEQILTWLDTDSPRFILVLGDFGTGKTFLLRTLAQRLARERELVPVLVTMRELTKGRTLDQLLAQHMSGEDSYHRASFRYLLRQGRIVLLFDGFDELAQRTDYDRVVNHFDTLREAAGGSAKVIVTSRHQYFVTDRDVRTALGGHAQALAGSRIMRLRPLDPGQRRTLVVKDFNDNEVHADRFLELLGSVRDLLDLAENPRMLSFMIRWYRTGWLTDARLTPDDGEPMTAGLLYERLLTTWLEHEYHRQDEIGGRGALSVAERREVLTEVGLRLWVNGEATVAAIELGDAAAKVVDLNRLQMSPAEAAQTIGSSTVLVRLGEDAFSFIHQSMLEWLIARWVADSFREPAAESAEQRLSRRALSPLMVDFLCDLTGGEVVVRWASGVVQSSAGAESAAMANAALILQRRGVVVRAVNYRGADLRGRDLSNQDLTGADLSAADLSGAVLPRALRGANLRRARLIAARLDGSDLTGADLTEADLTRARLIGADLRKARLAGARLDRAVLVGAAVDAGTLATAASTFGTAFPGWRAQAQIGPASIVYAVAVVPGGILATGHGDGTVRLWDSGTGAALRTLHGHTDWVRALAVDPAGRWLASAGDNVVRLWDPGTGAALRTLHGHTDWIRALAVDPAGTWLASAGTDNTVRLWDPTTGAALQSWTGHSDWIRALAVDPAGGWLASAGDDHTVRLWDPTTATELCTLTGHTGGVFALAVDPAGGWLASAGDDNTVRLWDPTTATEPRTLTGHTGGVFALAVDPAGGWLASAGDDHTVRLWDPTAATALRTLSGHTGRICALAVNPTSTWLASAGDDNTVRLWDLTTATALRTLTGHTGRICALAVNPTSTWLACAGDDNTVRLWDPSTGTPQRALDGQAGVFALAADPAGTWLACAGDDNAVRLWDPATGAPRCTADGHTGRIWALAADPAGAWLASAGTDNAVRVWDPSTGAALRTLDGHAGGVFALAVDPAGQWLASAGGDNTVRLWDPTTATTLRTLRGHTGRIWALAVDPAGQWLASAGTDNTVRLWDPRTGAALRTLAGHKHGVFALAVDPDGQWLASAGGDNTVRLWDPSTGTTLRTLNGHSDWVFALAVDPAGHWLASAGTDNVVRLWDPVSTALLATLIASAEGWAVLLPEGNHKLGGNPADLWWTIGLCRFDPADLADITRYQPQLQHLPHDTPIRDDLSR